MSNSFMKSIQVQRTITTCIRLRPLLLKIFILSYKDTKNVSNKTDFI
ncbi:hypothetical protein HMPREF9148_02447 [Prevotella sp. F0091]|nr:hypothetical protein HMPREF9148_02447 [Prevotella sp. F0091]